MTSSYSYQESLNLLADGEWTKLPIQNRASVMQSIENEVARREGRLPCSVSVFSEPRRNAGITAGAYNPMNDKIEMNEYHLRGDPAGCLNTILHEGRHAYQDKAIKGEIYHHDKAELKTWQNNMKPGHYVTYEQNRKRYYHQPIEADAREYASITSRQIFAEQKIQLRTLQNSQRNEHQRGVVNNLPSQPFSGQYGQARQTTGLEATLKQVSQQSTAKESNKGINTALQQVSQHSAKNSIVTGQSGNQGLESALKNVGKPGQSGGCTSSSGLNDGQINPMGQAR